MKITLQETIATVLAALLLATPTTPLLAQAATSPDDDEEEDVIVLSPFSVSVSEVSGYAAATTLAGARMPTSLGATPGGAQDINYFRSGAGRGEVPHPDTITAEGLFSEHDLPLDLGTTSRELFQVQTAAIPATFEAMPEVTHLAQLGFSSGLDAETWQPAPLNLIAVVDKSGSMSGQPLALVRASLHHVLNQLRNGDQFGVVLYGDRCHVHLPPTRVDALNRDQIRSWIDSIQSSGSTNMEAGLALGFEVAQRSASTFSGNTRVMLFTDERPNVGNTSAAGFMAMAESASRAGTGLTTIGVGVQFGAELATRISSVRGGNLFFFPDASEMAATFEEDFDTMVTELAHDFRVRIAPAWGQRIAGVFGLPGEALEWDGDAIVMNVATLFLSKRKGAIYFALAADETAQNTYLPAPQPRSNATLAHVDFSYLTANENRPVQARAKTRILRPGQVQAGLSRGRLLVDEFLTLRRATTAHVIENDQETAWRLVDGLRNRLHQSGDASLEPERQLVDEIHQSLAFLAGRSASDNPTAKPSPLLGQWTGRDAWEDEDELIIFGANGQVRLMEVGPYSRDIFWDETWLADAGLPTATKGELTLRDTQNTGITSIRYEISGGTLTFEPNSIFGELECRVFTRSSPTSELTRFTQEIQAPVDSLTGLPRRHPNDT